MVVSPRSQVSYEEFLTFPDDGVRREYVDGEVYEIPSPRARHQIVGGRIFLAFRLHLDAHGGGQVLYDFDVELRSGRRVCPDVVFVSDARIDALTEPCVAGVPSLIVEVVSDPRRDRFMKRNLYAEHGVPEYWIADADADRFEVDRLRDGGYGKPEIIQPGETLSPVELPRLVIDVATIFRR